MTYRLAASLGVLKSEVNAAYSGRPTASDGWIGDTAHSTRKSDHNPNAAGVVCAYDFTEWVQNGIEMNDVLAEHLRSLKDPRLKYVISDGRMFSSYATSSCRAWEWRAYTGFNGHFKHVHVSVHGAYDDRSSWGFGKAPIYSSTTPTVKDTNVMSPEQEKRILDALSNTNRRVGVVIENQRELAKRLAPDLILLNDDTDGKIS